MNTTMRWLAAALAAVATCGATAQSASPASAPARIAVSASDAKAADRKAVPQAEVGTVVRTGPTATDKAKAMTDDSAADDKRPRKASPAKPGASSVAPLKAD